MKNKKQKGPVVEQFSARERVEFLEANIVEALDLGQFKFRRGLGYLSCSAGTPCGCAIGVAAFVLGGCARFGFAPDLVVDTGIVTSEELQCLEMGYESGSGISPGGPRASGAFFQLGRRLRARDDADPTWEPKGVPDSVK